MPEAADHVDVLIVGAGLSGIGAACHLVTGRPGRSYAILEARDASGGTWDLFRYPGVRSDSDMFTLGYRFRPWTEKKALADGPSILEYVRSTAREHGVDEQIRYGHKVVGADWSGEDQCWTVTAVRDGEPVRITCDVLWSCSGYYDYDRGFRPDFEDLDDYEGTVVHPQHWPEDLDFADKQVLVIGSGATAVTLVPALADTAAHVTMLQRSPTYILSLPSVDPLAERLRARLPARAAYGITRWKNVLVATGIYQLSQRRPNFMRGLIRKGNVAQLPEGYDVDTHFRPRYDPWDQRLCLVPDGDLFTAIRKGSASVVTDRIERFTPKGVLLESGEELQADIVVTATGLNLLAFGGAELSVDGEPVKLPDTMAYKAMMLSGVPNFVYTIGYTNASWTLKADLVSEYLVRLLRHLDHTGQKVFEPRRDPSVGAEPFLDFAAGYVLRSVDDFPRQGDRAPWRLRQNYLRDVLSIRHGKVTDDAMTFSGGLTLFDRVLHPSLWQQVPRDHRQSPRDFRRRQLVTVLFVLIGAGVLAWSLRIAPGNSLFYPATLLLAAVWAVGAFASGPLHLGRIDVGEALRRPVLQPIALGLVLGGVFVGGGLLVHQLDFLSALDDQVRGVLDHADQGTGALTLVVTLVNGVAEELFFRGAVYAAIPRNPVLWSTVIYVVATLATGNVMLVFAAVLVGAVVALQRRASGGILAPMLTHVTWSVVMLYALPAVFL